LYFRYLKGRFVGPDGEVRLIVENKEDLTSFAEKKLRGISKIAQSDKLTVVEKEGADHLIATIKEKLQEF